MKTCLPIVLLGALALTAVSGATYEGHSVVRVEYSGRSQLWLRQTIKTLDLDVWGDTPGVKGVTGVMDVMVEPHQAHAFVSRARERGITARVVIEDVQKLIDGQLLSVKSRPKPKDCAVDSTTYRDLDQLKCELTHLERSYPDLFSTYVGGVTHEGREITVAKVSSGGADTRPAVWIDCGVHGREWVSQATCMYFLDQLTSQYGSDDELTKLVDTYDLHILPVANPDGYVYTWEQDRLWRKNRAPHGICFGVDCNRNFASNFGGPGASNFTCSQIYNGPYAFSEAESSAIRDSNVALGKRVKGFFSVHAYSQFWMTPYGYTSDLPADYDEMIRVTDIGVAALEAVHGTQYTSGNIVDVVYLASGGSTDWVYDSLGVIYPYALELRDTGTFGFMLPERQILPTGEETLAGITAAILAFA